MAALDIDLDCTKCGTEDALHVGAHFQPTVTCRHCGHTFQMDWDEDAGGNLYGLPITDEDEP